MISQGRKAIETHLCQSKVDKNLIFGQLIQGGFEHKRLSNLIINRNRKLPLGTLLVDVVKLGEGLFHQG